MRNKGWKSEHSNVTMVPSSFCSLVQNSNSGTLYLYTIRNAASLTYTVASIAQQVRRETIIHEFALKVWPCIFHDNEVVLVASWLHIWWGAEMSAQSPDFSRSASHSNANTISLFQKMYLDALRSTHCDSITEPALLYLQDYNNRS